LSQNISYIHRSLNTQVYARHENTTLPVYSILTAVGDEESGNGISYNIKCWQVEWGKLPTAFGTHSGST